MTPEIRDALHHVRQIGNKAAHDSRMFRYSEALLSCEAVYTIVKWYVEVYGHVDVTVPDYQDPSHRAEQAYGITELEVRLKALEELLIASVQKPAEESVHGEVAATKQGWNQNLIDFQLDQSSANGLFTKVLDMISSIEALNTIESTTIA